MCNINGKESTVNRALDAAPIPVESLCVLLFAKKNFSCCKTQQLILGTGIAIWWLTEPHYQIIGRRASLFLFKFDCNAFHNIAKIAVS
jgi:hypothetical protein